MLFCTICLLVPVIKTILQYYWPTRYAYARCACLQAHEVAELFDWKKCAVLLCTCLATLALLSRLSIFAKAAFAVVFLLFFLTYTYFSFCKWRRLFRQRLPRSDPQCASHDRSKIPRLNTSLRGDVFDHQYLSFSQYMFGQLFVQPNAFAMQLMGMMLLLVRLQLRSWRLIKPSVDHGRLVAKFILGTSLAKNFAKEEANHVGVFNFRGLPKFAEDMESWAATDLTVKINLMEQSLEEAWLGETQKLDDASDIFLLLLLYFALVGHVHNHSYGNWGANTDHPNVFLRLMAVVTVCFNSYGNVDNWVTTGFTGAAAGGRQGQGRFTKLLKHVSGLGVDSHSQVMKLEEYSTYVKFFLKIRVAFRKTFKKYQQEFDGISEEGLFQATIVHSLDHSQSCKIWADPLWCTPTTKAYEGMAWTAQVSRAGFAEELPWLLFHTKFKTSPHPFFQEIYEEAIKIQEDYQLPNYADSLETCIVR